MVDVTLKIPPQHTYFLDVFNGPSKSIYFNPKKHPLPRFLGIFPGDRLLEINGKPVSAFDSAKKLVQYIRDQTSEMTWIVRRRGRMTKKYWITESKTKHQNGVYLPV